MKAQVNQKLRRMQRVKESRFKQLAKKAQEFSTNELTQVSARIVHLRAIEAEKEAVEAKIKRLEALYRRAIEFEDRRARKILPQIAIEKRLLGDLESIIDVEKETVLELLRE